MEDSLVIYQKVMHRTTLLLSHFSRVRLCATPSLGFSRQEHWSGLPFPSPMHKSEKWKWPYDPAIPFLGIYQKELKTGTQESIYTHHYLHQQNGTNNPNVHQCMNGSTDCWKWKWKWLSCLILCNSMDCTVNGILQARILEWVAFHFSRGSSQPRDWTQVSHMAGGFSTSWAIRETLVYT